MTPLTIILLVVAGLFTSMYWLLKPTQEPTPVETYSEQKSIADIIAIIRDGGYATWELGCEQVHEGTDFQLTLEKVTIVPNTTLVFKMRLRMNSDYAPRIMEVVEQYPPATGADLAQTLEDLELVDSRRRKLRLLAA